MHSLLHLEQAVRGHGERWRGLKRLGMHLCHINNKLLRAYRSMPVLPTHAQSLLACVGMYKRMPNHV